MTFNDAEPSGPLPPKPPQPTLNGNDMDLWKNAGKNMTSSDEEPNGNDVDLSFTVV